MKNGFKDRVDAYRSTIIRAELWRSHGNVTAAAKSLELHRNTLVRWMRQLSIPSDPRRRWGGRRRNYL